MAAPHSFEFDPLADDGYVPPDAPMDSDDGAGPDNVRPLRPSCSKPSCWELDGDHNPHGPDVHRLGNDVGSYRWLLAEVGIGRLSGVFMRGGAPVYTSAIGEDGYIAPPETAEDAPEHRRDHNGPATMRTVTAKTLRARLAVDYLVWQSEGKGTSSRRVERFFPHEPADLAIEGIHQGVAPNIRHLVGITHTPMVRADGTILDTPGYDDATGFLYLPDVDVGDIDPVPTSPTARQREHAVAVIREMIGEFKWFGPHDEANFIGALLTPLLRLVCPPPYKMIAIMARQPGSGKSLLNRIIREVHGGVFRSEMPHDDAELEKAVSSILTCTTAPVVQFDNVSGVLRSSRLAGLLTTAVYSGRLLGSTNETPMTNDRLWSVTGNNLSFGGDLIRRTLWITIDPKVPDPHLRTGFRLDIPEFLREHRRDILHALLTMVAAWTADGRPLLQSKSSDDYNLWTRTVGGILANLEIPGLGTFGHEESAQQTIGADDEGWGDFLAAVHDVMGGRPWTTKELVARMSDRKIGQGPAGQPFRTNDPSDAAEALIEALPAELNEKFHRAGGRAITQSLGKWVRNRNGRWAGDVVCEQVGTESRTKSAIWQIRRADGDAQ